jgi:hypothetical protein
MDVFKEGIPAESHNDLEVCLKHLDDYNKFRMFNRYLGASLDTAYHIV